MIGRRDRGTLVAALGYFGVCFVVWMLPGATAPFVAEELSLSVAETGALLAVPVFAGAFLRLPLGFLSEYVGRKNAALLNLGIVAAGLFYGWTCVDSRAEAMLLGVPLGVAGASFGVALSLGAGWYPPRLKGLAMGIAGAGNCGAVLAVWLAPPLALAHGWRSVYAIALPLVGIATLGVWIFAAEPPDGERRPLRDYLRILVERDAWVFSLVYTVTFGGYVGLTSFLPTLFHEEYAIPKEHVGRYAAGIVLTGSVLRVAGGWLADRVGGVRVVAWLAWLIAGGIGLAATLPPDPWAMVAILVACFAAMGAGNGAVFQLVAIRFSRATAVASSLVGEVGALAGALVPLTMGAGREWTGSFAFGFGCLLALSCAALVTLLWVARRWAGSWVAEGGRAIEHAAAAPEPAE